MRPLKALTVCHADDSRQLFQQVYNMADSIIVGQFVGSSALAAVGACAALTNVFICVALGAGVGAGVRKPLFRRQRVWQNENHCIYLPDQLFTSEYHPGRLWLLLFPCDDERIADPCRYSGEGGTVLMGLFCGFSIFCSCITFSLPCSRPSVNQKFRWDC